MSGRSRRRDKNNSAHAQAVTSLVIVLLLHMFLFCFMFDLVEYLPFSEKFFISSKFGVILFVVTVCLMVMILINRYFKESDVLSIHMGEKEKRRGYILIIVFVVLLFASIFFFSVLE